MTKRAGLRMILAVLLVFLLTFGLVGCNPYDHHVTVVLNNINEIENTYQLSPFKNALLADIKTEHIIGQTTVEEDGMTVTKDIEFLGWHPDPAASEGMYKAKGLARYDELKEYISNDVVVLYAIYGIKVIEKHDLIIGWYGQSVAGLTDAIIERYTDALKTWLGEVDELDGVDIVLRKYIGDVATSTAEIKADGGADILFGWGGNLTSLGGIEPIARQDNVSMGNKTGRYIDLIRETEKMYNTSTSLSKAVWDWTVLNQQLFAA